MKFKISVVTALKKFELMTMMVMLTIKVRVNVMTLFMAKVMTSLIASLLIQC